MRNTPVSQIAALALASFASLIVFGQSAPANSLKPQSESAAKLKRVRSIKLSGLRDDFALSANGSTLATYQESNGQDSSVKVWDTRTWKVKRAWRISSTSELALSTNGKTLAISSALPYDERETYIPYQVSLWDVSSGKLLVRLPKGTFDQPSLKTIIFSPDGKLIVTDSAVWNVKTGKRLWSIKHQYIWPSFAFSPDSQLLATSQGAGYYGADGRVRLWNARTGKPVNVIGVIGEVNDINGADGPILFSSDGRQLVTSGKPPNWKPPVGNYGDSGYPIAGLLKNNLQETDIGLFVIDNKNFSGF